MTMFGHLSKARLMEVAEGVSSPEAELHVAECAACQELAEAARGALRMARRTDIPEPSPLYWEVFRRQVGSRIATQAPLRRRWAFAGLPAFAALAAVIAVALGLAARGPGPPALATPAPRLPAWSALPSADDDVGLGVIQALAPSAEELAGAEGFRVTYDCLGSLSDEESAALADALRAEMGGRNL